MKKLTLITIFAILSISCQKELCTCINLNPPGCVPPTFVNDGSILGNTSGNGKADGAIWFKPKTGFPPYRYSIDGGKNWKTGFDSGCDFYGLPAGKYQLTMIDNHNCQSLIIEHELK